MIGRQGGRSAGQLAVGDAPVSMTGRWGGRSAGRTAVGDTPAPGAGSRSGRPTEAGWSRTSERYRAGMLIDTIRADMTAAMKARDAVTLRTTRAIIAAVQEAEVAGSAATTLSDAEVEQVIRTQVKRRIEAAEAFDAGGRPEKAADERAELAVLESYLPEQLSDDELAALVDTVLADGGFSSMADMGPAMKAVNAQVAGRADGRTVADAVRARLTA